MEFLKGYLKAEGLRIGKKLNYQFEIGSEINPDEILIPTMLLQPFVENAIWHGISKRETGGMIHIRFLLSKNQLLCEVEDNGGGRRNKTHQPKSHKSRALDITKRRLQLLTEDQQEKAHLQIIDLEDKQGASIGTKVQVYLPIL